MLEQQQSIDESIERMRSWSGLRDQRALEQLLFADASFIHRMRVVPQRLINSYFSHNSSNGEIWEPGDCTKLL